MYCHRGARLLIGPSTYTIQCNAHDIWSAVAAAADADAGGHAGVVVAADTLASADTRAATAVAVSALFQSSP